MGGAEKIIASLARCLQESEVFQVSVISFFNAYDERVAKMLKVHNVKVIFLNKRKGLDLRFYKRLKQEITALQPDIIHSHSIHNLKYLLPFRDKSSLVHTLHNDLNEHCGRMRTALYYFIFKYYKIAPINISNRLNLRFNRLQGAEVIFNGIELVFTKEVRRDKKQILSVGRLERQKNHELLLQSFAIIKKEIPDAKLIIAGTGKRKEMLSKLSSELGISNSVKFLGQRSDTNALMAFSGLFILSSKWEGMPLVLIEALNNGCPVVATNVGGIADVVDEKVGYLATLNAEDIARKAIKILHNPMLAEKISKDAKERAKIFSAKEMSERYIQFYKKILS